MIFGFGCRDGLGFDQCLSDGVINRQLLDFGAPDQVHATVSQSRHVHDRATLAPKRGNYRRSHALEFAIQGSHRHNLVVRLYDTTADDGFRLVAAFDRNVQILSQFARYDLNGALARYFSGCLTAHPVRDETDRQVGELFNVERIFVVLSIISQQCTFADVQRQGHWATSSFHLGHRTQIADDAGRRVNRDTSEVPRLEKCGHNGPYDSNIPSESMTSNRVRPPRLLPKFTVAIRNAKPET